MTTPSNPKKRVLLNALWSLSGFLVTTIIMFAAVRIYIQQLGLAAYGIFTLAMSVLGIAGVFNLGLGEATTKFVAQYNAQQRPDRVTMVVAATALIYLAFSPAGYANFWNFVRRPHHRICHELGWSHL